MFVTFQNIYTEVLTQMGLTESSVDSTVLDSIKLRINQVQDWITNHRAWDWRQKKFYITTWAPYETGTASWTKGSATITTSGTTLADKYKMGYFLANGKQYKIKSISGTTDGSIVLMAPMDQTTASGQTYKIVFPDYILNHEIAGIVSVKIHNVELDFKKRSELTYDIAGVGEPKQCAIGDILWEDFYTSGTATVTNASASVSLSSGSLPDEVEGMTFRIAEFAKPFTVKTKGGAQALTLAENYQGSTGSGKTYAIGPKGSQILTFRHSPDATYFIEIEALVRAPKLIDANEYSIIPGNHAALLHGAIWLALTDRGDNPIRIQQARADFERALKQMEIEHTSNPNLKWTSAEEIAVRKSNLANFDPLRDHFDIT